MNLIIIIFSLLVVAPQLLWASPSKFYMTSSFQRSKKIWGTYNQYRESVIKTNSKGKRVYRKFYTSPLANLVIKNGEVHFIRPLNIEGKIKYQIKSFPYTRDKKNKIFKINPEGRNDELILFFKDNLKDLVKNDKQLKQMDFKDDDIQVIFEEFTCWQKRGKLHCQFPLNITELEKNDSQMEPKLSMEDIIKEKLAAPKR